MILATLIYIRTGGRTLMLHRIKKENDIHHEKWNGIGGKFEPGETPEDCAIRESREETGLNIKNPRLRGVLTFPDFDKGHDWYVFVFTATEFTGEMVESAEGHLKWIPDDELMNLNLWEGDYIFLPWLERDTFFSAKFSYTDGKLLGHSVSFYPLL